MLGVVVRTILLVRRREIEVMDMDGGGRGKYIREKECSRFCVVFFYF